MKFLNVSFVLVVLVTTSRAATVTFWTLDTLRRTVYFTANPGIDCPAPVAVSNQANTTVVFSSNFAGNFYAVQDGEENTPGMLGEFSFSDGMNFFDVSAIVAPYDFNNVKEIWPAESGYPISGCKIFPCDNCYWQPHDDWQVRGTMETDFICTLGTVR